MEARSSDLFVRQKHLAFAVRNGSRVHLFLPKEPEPTIQLTYCEVVRLALCISLVAKCPTRITRAARRIYIDPQTQNKRNRHRRFLLFWENPAEPNFLPMVIWHPRQSKLRLREVNASLMTSGVLLAKFLISLRSIFTLRSQRTRVSSAHLFLAKEPKTRALPTAVLLFAVKTR